MTLSKLSDQEFRDLLKEGKTLYQISRQFNVMVKEVYKLGKDHNLLYTYQIPRPTKQDLESMYNDEQLTQKQIAKEFDVIGKSVSNWLHNYKIPTRGSNGTLAIPIPPKEDLLNYIDEGLNQHQIAEKCKVSDWKIYDWCEYYGISGMVNDYRFTTDEHINWRDAVFDRDHRTCHKCGATNTMLHPHHIVPYCDHPEVAYELENGITLCKQCHELIRGREYEYIEQFAAITQPHLRDHEVIESMPWEAPLPPLSDKLFPDYPQQEVIS